MQLSNHTRANRPSHPSPRAAGSALLAATTLLAGNVALGDVHDWTGSIDDDWHMPWNWNVNSVPGNGDSVIFLSGSFNNIFLNGDSANLTSLYIAGAKTVSTNGHVLEVTSGSATTTVTGGVDSKLFVANAGNGYAFRTDELTIQSNGRMQMAGGHARILDQLTLQSGGRIYGNGLVEVISSNPAAFNGLDGNPINVSNGDLRIEVNGGGSMVLPDLVTVVQDGRTLEIDAPMFLPVQDIELGTDCRIDFAENWTLAGSLSADPGAGAMSFVLGDGLMTAEGEISVTIGGHLAIESPADFMASADISIGSNATVELAHLADSPAGHVTLLGVNSRLLLTGGQYLSIWSGDIISNGGTIEVECPAGIWLHDGTLHLGSFGGLLTTVDGSAHFRAYGQVNAPGLGGIIDGTLDLMTGAAMHIALDHSNVFVNGMLRLESGTDTTGLGEIHVNAGGELFVADFANVDVSITNGGDMNAGDVVDPTGYAYIDGSYTQEDSGRLVVEIGGPAPTDRDVYETSQSATVAGEIAVELLDGYVPTPGDQFEILYANGGIFGAFEMLSGEPGFVVSTNGNVVTLTYEGVDTCPADIDGDGAVNVTDLLAVITSWGACEDCPADVDGSGVVDVLDLLAVFNQWGVCAAL